MITHRHRPIEVQAFQFNSINQPLPVWVSLCFVTNHSRRVPGQLFWMEQLHENGPATKLKLMHVTRENGEAFAIRTGSWLICGEGYRVVVMSDNLFRVMYEPATEPALTWPAPDPVKVVADSQLVDNQPWCPELPAIHAGD